MRRGGKQAPAEKAAAGLLFGVSVLHLPAIYLLTNRPEGDPSYWLVPLSFVAMGAAWGSGVMIEGRRHHPLPWLAAAVSLIELPLALVLGAPWGNLFIAAVGGVSALALGALVALLRVRQSM